MPEALGKAQSRLTLAEARVMVEDIIARYDADPEAAHSREDDLLARYVRDKARQGDMTAKALTALLDADRERWYA